MYTGASTGCFQEDGQQPNYNYQATGVFSCREAAGLLFAMTSDCCVSSQSGRIAVKIISYLEQVFIL